MLVATKTSKITDLQKITYQVRRDIIRMVNAVESGHPGGSLGCTEYFVALFFEIMKHNPQSFNMDGIGEDVFFLSNGHISPAYYSVLARCGYFDLKELATFRKIDSRLQGHPATAEHLPGVRIATGSLGQGLSVALGAALAKKLNNDSHIVYSLHGDGEIQEGQIWEAAMFASARKIDNIIATIDVNGKQIDGNVEDVLPLGDIKAKWLAFGWDVIELKDGNDLQKVIDTLKFAQTCLGKQKPVVILMKTIMGKGVDFMEDNYKWHGVAPDAKQTETALKQLEETLGDY
jgi:transketolase